VASGPWARTTVAGATATVTSRAGATLVQRNLQGRRLTPVAHTCRRCGSVAVYFRGRLVKRRALRIATFRRVAIDALVVSYPGRRR
jgi:hypothetical protein